MHKAACRLLNLMAVLMLATTACAAVTPITVQGSIKDSGGTPVTGTHSMAFRIYDNAVGGTLLWTEAHASVAFTNGIYSATLGSTTSLDGIFGAGAQLWLSVSLDAGSEFTPRQQLAATAYANYSHQAGTANTLDGATSPSFSLASHTHPQTIVYGGHSSPAVAINDYLMLNGGDSAPAESRVQMPAISNMTIKKLALCLPPFAVGGYTLTLRKNGAATALNVPINIAVAGANPTYGSVTGNIAVSEGDMLSLQISNASASGLSYSILAER